MQKFIYLLLALTLFACTTAPKSDANFISEVDQYLVDYNKKFQELMIPAAEAAWKLNTYILEGDTITSKIAEEAEKAMVEFTGSESNISTAKKYLEREDELSPVQIRQLRAILYSAASSPSIVKDLVEEKIKAENNQTTTLYGFNFMLDGKKISTNDIDKVLESSTNLVERLAAWQASKEVGRELKTGLENLRNLRNKTVQALEFEDYFHYQVSDYGYSSDELMEVCRNMNKDVWPLYRELHTWARYTLAEKYNEDVPEYLPAHWLPNRWGQEWSSMVSTEGVDLDGELEKKGAEWVMEEGERFWMSMGFPELPKSFYEKSSLYPLPPDANYSKNNHASAWHMDNAYDVRSLMSVEPNTRWWGTVLHELGHIYYYMTYTNDSVPIILRGGANRAYHEAMGTLIGLASMQQPFLEGVGLMPEGTEIDETEAMLKEALDYIVLIPWGAGVMTEFEHDLYAKNLSVDEFNKRWWDLKKKYQGIVPPSERGEEYCDAASKTHINNDAAQYYDYAMSNILLFQFHDHISKNILEQDPHKTNYYGSKETGDFMRTLMKDGANCDWRDHLNTHLGTDMSAKAMVDYFSPLMTWLKEQNKGRTHSLPETL
ncbi:MAG: M2 family metallopeptidase [Bacteroidia bacterium]|nr:M2 family metallopeptidase [Bacteroidia bacterium]NNJ55811.1 M2 family metallopeptidase [Bacteroidia bacterium]